MTWILAFNWLNNLPYINHIHPKFGTKELNLTFGLQHPIGRESIWRGIWRSSMKYALSVACCHPSGGTSHQALKYRTIPGCCKFANALTSWTIFFFASSHLGTEIRLIAYSCSSIFFLALKTTPYPLLPKNCQWLKSAKYLGITKRYFRSLISTVRHMWHGSTRARLYTRLKYLRYGFYCLSKIDTTSRGEQSSALLEYILNYN